MKPVEYSPTITFGNILTIIGMLFTIIGCYVAHEKRIVVLETQVPAIAATVNKVAVSQELNTKSLERLVILSEERARVQKP